MKVRFVTRENGPEKLVCEAELLFDDVELVAPMPDSSGNVFRMENPLRGLKLVGFSLWRTPEGELYVTFPSRAFGVASDRRYFDYIRPDDGGIAATKALKDWIVASYHNHVKGIR